MVRGPAHIGLQYGLANIQASICELRGCLDSSEREVGECKIYVVHVHGFSCTCLPLLPKRVWMGGGE